MQLPFYLSFREFENQYYNNLELWFEKDKNASEIDFLLYLKEMYKPYLSYSFDEDRLQADANIEISHTYFSSQGNFGISFSADAKMPGNLLGKITEKKFISMMEYSQHILDRIHQYFQNNNCSVKENETLLNYINLYEIIAQNTDIGYCLNYREHQKTLSFLKAFLPKFGTSVDMGLYRIFYFSVVRIADYIDAKLNAVEAFDQSICNELKTEAKMQIHSRNRTFLTVCN